MPRGEEHLRICHVIESASGGSAAIMVGIALESVRLGHEVHVVYSPEREDPKLIEALRAGGCASLIAVPMRRSVGPWDLVDGLRLRKALKSLGDLDVIHSQSSKAGALCRLLCHFRGTAQIYSPHGFYSMTDEAPFYVGPVERVLSSFCDAIIAVSEFEREHALSLGIDGSRVVVVPNGIPPYEPVERAKARDELGLEPDNFVVGFVGRLCHQKNPIDAVKAIDLMKTPGAHLVMVGGGELAEEVRAHAAEHGSRVTFCGPVLARPLYRAFDALVCTSHYEGMAVTFLEALNCGTPIVAYPVGGTAELVEEGRTGFVTAPRPDAAAAGLDRIAAMLPAEREAMAEACRAKGTENSEAVMTSKTLDVYRKALAKRGRVAD